MIKLFIDIPHIEPKLEIVYQNEQLVDVLYNMFAPYAFEHPIDGNSYNRLIFRSNEEGKIIVEEQGEVKIISTGVVAYIEEYLILHSKTDPGYVMLHGGGVAKNKKAFLFLANSMVGKSTLVSYLTKEGFAYITDDRLIIDVNEMTILPYTRAIMLRPGGIALLKNHYGCALNTIFQTYQRTHKELYRPDVYITENVQIAGIFVLIRVDGAQMRREVVDNDRRLTELLKYSLSTNVGESLKDFLKMSFVKLEVIYYSDLKEVASYLNEISCQ